MSVVHYEVPLYMKGVGDSVYYEEDSSAIKIHYADMKLMFDPVIAKIIALLQDQLDAVIKQSGAAKLKVNHCCFFHTSLMLPNEL